MTTIAEARPFVTGRVDTHLDVHVAAVVTAVGGVLGTEQFPTTAVGYQQLLTWMRGFGQLARVGVEAPAPTGCRLPGTCGPGRLRSWRSCDPTGRSAGATARPTPSMRSRPRGRCCPVRPTNATPKTHDGPVEALRTLKVLQRSATKARTQALNQLRALLVTAPDELRARLRDLTQRDLLATCAAFRVNDDDDSLAAVTRFGLRELAQVKLRLKRITEQVAPALTALKGVGPDVASTLLLAAGDNPERLVSEQSFASLCGVSPVQASSGKTHRHRLNRGGDRQVNAALWRSRSSGLTATSAPRTTSPNASATARAKPKRSAASSAT